MSKSQQLALTIDGNTITQDENGLYSLNDIFKVSDSDLDKHSPKRWVRLQRTLKLISELESEHDLSTVKRLINSDKKAGTFVCMELVYAYAMAISPKFELKVIRGFHAAAVKEHRLAKLHGNAEWHQNREQGKTQRRELTDVIQQFSQYAAASGSKSADRYYQTITRMIQLSCGVESRETATPDQLAVLAVAEIVAERAIRKDLNRATEYHQIYRNAKRAVFDSVLSMPEVA